MNKKEKNTLIILLFCASAVLMILYSPIGSSGANNYSNSYVQNYSIVVGGEIQNAPKGNNLGNNRSSGVFGGSNVPINASLPNAGVSSVSFPAVTLPENLSTTGTRINNNSQVSVGAVSFTRQAATYAVATTVESTVASSNMALSSQSGQVYSNNSTGSTSGGYGGGIASVLPSTIFRGKTNNETESQNGFTTLNTDLTSSNDLTASQGGGYTPGSGATDPGEDPLENPIPVSDGFWLLLLMAIAYSYIIFVKKKGLLKELN